MTDHCHHALGARRIATSISVLSVLAILAGAGTAQANKVKGRVENYRQLVNPVWEEARDPKNKLYSFREIVPTVPAQYRRMFPHIPKELCITALSSVPQGAQKTAVLIRVGGGRTTPVTIVVAPQTRLQFKNTDPFTHRLYALKDNAVVRTFIPSDTIKGGTREFTVPGQGIFEVRDELAPSLRMWIVAEPNVAALGYPSMKGEFALALQPGEYEVQAFFAGKKVGEPRAITVKDGDLDLSKEPLKVAADPKKAEKKDKEEGKSDDESAGDKKDEAKSDEAKPEEKK